MDHYAIIGNPIEHSRSPKIHRLFGEQLQHALVYETIEATEKTFQEKVEGFFTKGGKGINVTVPFKRLAFSISDKLGVDASSCGAVNTLSFSEDGRVYGESTDGTGLVEDLKNNNLNIENKSVLIIGAGGTAQSIIPSLLANNVAQVFITNRTLSNAIKLKEQYLHLTEIECLDGGSINRNFDLVDPFFKQQKTIREPQLTQPAPRVPNSSPPLAKTLTFSCGPKEIRHSGKAFPK